LWFRLVSSFIVCTVNYWVQTLISNTPGNFIWNILHLLKYKGGSDVKFAGYIMGALLVEVIQSLLASQYSWKDSKENKCLTYFSILTLFYERLKSCVKHLHLVLCVLVFTHWHVHVQQGREFVAIKRLSKTLQWHVQGTEGLYNGLKCFCMICMCVCN
jgi:hypothetical protein